MDDPEAVEAFKAQHHLSDEDLTTLQAFKLPAERKIQDYRSTYNDIRDWLRREKAADEQGTVHHRLGRCGLRGGPAEIAGDQSGLHPGTDLREEQEGQGQSELVEEVRRVIRASLGNRAKESLMVDFINQTDLDRLRDKASVIEAFFTFAQAEQQREAQRVDCRRKPECRGGEAIYQPPR